MVFLLAEGDRIVVTQGPHLGTKGQIVQVTPTHCHVLVDHEIRCDGVWYKRSHLKWESTVWKVGDLEYVITGKECPAVAGARELMNEGFLPLVDAAVREELNISPHIEFDPDDIEILE